MTMTGGIVGNFSRLNVLEKMAAEALYVSLQST